MKKIISVLLITAILLGSVFLTSCEKAVTTEELLDIPFYVYYDQIDRSADDTLPYRFEDNVEPIPSKYDGTVEPPHQELYERGSIIAYFEEEYELFAPISVWPWFNEYAIPEGCADMFSETARVYYNYVTKEPYEINYHGTEADDKTRKADARIEEIAYDFIETELNGKYKKGIDIDDYEVYVSYDSDIDAYWVEYRLFVNEVVVHRIGLTVQPSGRITRWSALTVPDDDLLERIPNITKEQYIELALHHLELAYKKQNDDFEIYNAELETVRHGSLVYNSKTEDYFLHFELRYDIRSGEDGKQESRSLHFAIPLNNN